jgi:hypothetical protein
MLNSGNISSIGMVNDSQLREPLRLALGHQSRVGKDTFADYVLYRFGGVKLSFAGDLYEVAGCVQKYLGKPVEKDPNLLQLLGTMLRDHYSQDLWIERLEKKIDRITKNNPHENIVITDVRFPNELEFVRRNGFVAVGIDRPERPLDRNQAHISENGLSIGDFDYRIKNNEKEIDYYEKIDKFIERIQKT